MKSFPSFRQLDARDCGPACLKIILEYYGKHVALNELASLTNARKTGTTFSDLSLAAEIHCLRSVGVKVSYEVLKRDIHLPCIIHWEGNHFVVVYKIEEERVYVSDPAFGLAVYETKDFLSSWLRGKERGYVLVLETSGEFIVEKQNDGLSRSNLNFLWEYLVKYRESFSLILLGLIAVTLIQLIVPFLTQAIVDFGVQNNDVDFIKILLLAQIALVTGRIFIEIIRNRILLNVGSKIRISILSDFLLKLMRLPIGFFDSKLSGDILQRINDNRKIQAFLTSTSLNLLFSLLNIFIFSIVLLYYNRVIFSVFIIGGLIYFAWIFTFQKRRALLNYQLFSKVSEEQSRAIELIYGIQEIKLNNAEREMRWDWEGLQSKIHKIEDRNLVVEQIQTAGASFLLELKNIVIIFIAARLVLQGGLTIGMMLSISFIAGQLNAPLVQLLDFLHNFQYTRISLARLTEIERYEPELAVLPSGSPELATNQLTFDVVDFKFPGARRNVLTNFSITILKNKVTAIVGPSGSGKTTMLKLLLRIYEPTSGNVFVGDTNLKFIPPSIWRQTCGVVMQDGFIFSDSLLKNIVLGSTEVDQGRLRDALELSHVSDFIDELPLGINTLIGHDGLNLSAGQKQRILIARAVYKNPEFLFLDEATSALDANKEASVVENLEQFFRNRTVVIIAHRLSTIRRADQIIVLDQDGSVEVGSHMHLMNLKGRYHNLVKNQIEN